MSYIVQRQDRFYVVAYDGLDPLTGKERRRWHPAGRDRAEADAMARVVLAEAQAHGLHRLARVAAAELG